MTISAQIKSLTRHSAIYTISTVIQRAEGFLLLPILTDTTYLATKGEYGDYTLIYTFIAFMNVFYLYGIDAAFLRYYFLGAQKKEDVYRSAVQILSLTSLVSSGLIFLLAEPLSFLIFNENGYVFFVKIAAAILLVDSLCSIPYLILRAEERSVLFTVIRLGRFLLELILDIVFVVFLKTGVQGILYANLLAALINLLVLIPSQVHYLGGKFSFSAVRDLLRFGLPMIPNGIAYLVVEISDRYLMLHLLDKEKVGVYSANHKFGTVMLLLVTAFRTAWQPFFLKVAGQADARKIYSRVMTYYVLGASFTVLAGSMFVEYLVKLPLTGQTTILGREYWGGIQIIPLILLSYMLYGVYINLMVGIYIQKKSEWMALFTGLAAVVNIAANFYLMPRYGLIGAAMASLLAYAVMTLSIYYANQKIYAVPYEARRLAIVIGYLLAGLLIFYFIPIGIYSRLILVLAMPLLLFVLNFFSEEEKAFLLHLLIRKNKA
jgi:O-antigen/teichoic acid export membrane protein